MEMGSYKERKGPLDVQLNSLVDDLRDMDSQGFSKPWAKKLWQRMGSHSS